MLDVSSMAHEKDSMSAKEETVREHLLATIRGAAPEQFLTLHALCKKLDTYAPITIQGGLRQLLKTGEITSYEHPSFPNRPIYRLREGGEK